MTNAMPIAAPTLNLAERQAENLVEFITRLGQSRFWHILPKGEVDLTKAVAFFDARTGRSLPPVTALRAFLDKHPFVHVRSVRATKNLAMLQSSTNLLWNNEDSDHTYSPADAGRLVEQFRWAGLENWRLPTADMLKRFAMNDSNPYRVSIKYRLATVDGKEEAYWLSAGGRRNLDEGSWGVGPEGSGAIFACNLHWQDSSDIAILTDLMNREWQLVTPQGEEFDAASVNGQGAGLRAALRAALDNQDIDACKPELAGKPKPDRSGADNDDFVKVLHGISPI